MAFSDYIKNRLDRIQKYAKTTVTFNLYRDTAIQDVYGQPTKTTVASIITDVIIGPVKHDDTFEGQGIDETSDTRIIVHRLTAGGVDYINLEWFSNTNMQNWEITAGDAIYRVVDKQGHTDLDTTSPYLVLYCTRKLVQD